MVIKKIKEKGIAAKEKAIKIQQETRKHVTTAIAAAFGFVIALVWRDAIRKMIDSIVIRLGIPETVYVYEIVVAVIITIVCVLGIMVISRYSVKKK